MSFRREILFHSQTYNFSQGLEGKKDLPLFPLLANSVVEIKTHYNIKHKHVRYKNGSFMMKGGCMHQADAVGSVGTMCCSVAGQ